MSLLNAGRELNRKHVIAPNNVYIGTVVNNDDPQRLQRIRARIHDIHRQIKDDHLPWCLPLVLLFGSNAEIGQHGPIPTLGSRVYITYLDDSAYYPVYFGGTVSNDRKLSDFTSGDLESDYPNVFGSIDRSGNRWVVNTTKDQVEFTHVSGTRISIDGSGHVQLDISNNRVGPNAQDLWPAGLTINISGDLGINVSGNTHLKTGGSFRIDAGGTSHIVSGGSSNLHSHSSIDIDASGRIDLGISSSPVSVQSPNEISSSPRNRPIEETLENLLNY